MKTFFGAALAGAAILTLSIGAPAGAIETQTFGMDPGEPSADGRLHIPVGAGRSTSGELRLWNKGSEPLVLRLSAAAATVDGDGNAVLGGDEAPVRWTRVEPAEVALGPEEDRTVTVRVRAPRRMGAAATTLAVIAEPAQDSAGAPTVVQRVAVTTFLEPHQGSLVAGLGWSVWIALVLVVLLVLLVVRSAVLFRPRPDRR